MPARPQLSVDPRRFRLSFVAAFVVGQALICGGFATQFLITRAAHFTAFEHRILADIVVLEDHVSRSLDVAAARVTLVAAAGRGTAGETASGRLRESIADTPVIRSLSLAGADGTILDSSTPANLGARLPEGVLPRAGSRDPARSLSFGGAFGGRDLHDLRPPAADGATIWLASRAADGAPDGRRWVAAINLSMFVNLWSRLRDDLPAEIALFGYDGTRIVAHNPLPSGTAALGPALAAAAERSGRGSMTAEQTGGTIVTFRVSPNHPFVLAIAGDGRTLRQEHMDAQLIPMVAAALAALLLTVALLILYRWYLRYEASVIEMRNQALAIGEHVMVSEADAAGRIVDVNDSFLRICGYTRREVVGQDHRMFNSGLHSPEFYRQLWQTIAAGRIWHGTLRNRAKSGAFYWVSATIIPFKDAWGRTLRHVALYSDISAAVAASETLASERRMRAELSAANKALLTDIHTDHLTGVANRRGMDAFLAELRGMPDAAGEPVSVLVLDIDHFKRVNDGWGHGAGDSVLREAAARWRRTLRTSDLLARMGGEEFCVMLPRTPAPNALFVAHKLCEAMRAAPFAIEGPSGPALIDVTVSIGIAATRTGPDMDIQPAIEQADAALYRAKNSGRNRAELHGARGGGA